MKKGLYTTVYPQGESPEGYPTEEHEPNSLVNVGLAGLFQVEGTGSNQSYADLNGNLYEIDDRSLGSGRLAVGLGTTAVSYDDNALENRVGTTDVFSEAHGLDDGEAVARFTYSGTIPNNSGGVWSVSETGLIASLYTTAGSNQRFLFARDTFPGQEVRDGEQISVDLEFTSP